MRPAYHIARYEARSIRALYSRLLPVISRSAVTPARSLPVHVVAFSSARDLPEQVASLRSFLRFAGAPRSFTVASDGSHTEQQRRLLRRVHPSVDVVDWDRYARDDLPEKVFRYARVNPMGKKLAVIASLPSEPTVYVDSDVLFFPGASSSSAARILSAETSRYQTQGWRDGYMHELLSNTAGEPVNAGFIIVAEPLDWTSAFAKLPDEPRADDVYLEQTLVHIAMRDANALPLPIREFPLHNKDQFFFRDAHPPDETVLRHYVSVTRPKFWLAVARQSTVAPVTSLIPERFTDRPPAPLPVVT